MRSKGARHTRGGITLDIGPEVAGHEIWYTLTIHGQCGRVALASPRVRFTPTSCSNFEFNFDEGDSLAVHQVSVGSLGLVYAT